MFKRRLIFIVFLCLAVNVCIQSEDIFLAYYAFFPLLMIALFFFLEEQYRPFFLKAAFVVSGIYFVYLVRRPSFEAVLFGMGNLLFMGTFFLYRRMWAGRLQLESDQCGVALREFEALKEKHRSRLESLHHLEKQVGGLLNLFEIARDFNDCLSFEGMAQMLFERVMPQLPFKRFRMILLEKGVSQASIQKIFSITQHGFEELASPEPLAGHEKDLFGKVLQTKRMLQETDTLVFPLVVDEEIDAVLMIEGTQADDLAKFEVLAAYMTLQVRKIRLYETVKELSIRDGLTGVFVRRHFLERFEEELKRSMKYNLPLAVLMLDIDHFKRYNDDYGHLAGDATLKQSASLLRQNLRKVDIVARYGGEEFAIVIPETSRAEAAEVAERIRSSIARHNFKVYNDQTQVTVSIGIALFPENLQSGAPFGPEVSEITNQLIQMADNALYRSKEEGRNRVVLFSDL